VLKPGTPDFGSSRAMTAQGIRTLTEDTLMMLTRKSPCGVFVKVFILARRVKVA